MAFDIDQYTNQSIAAGAVVGVVAVTAAIAIAENIAIRQQLADFEQRMLDHKHPDLCFQPIRREFMLARLESAGVYLFEELPKELATLREINIDLHAIATRPFYMFDELNFRILLAGEGLLDDAKAKEFAGLIDQPLKWPEPFDPKESELHAEFAGTEIMRKQHDYITKVTRGESYKGDYSRDSEQRKVNMQTSFYELTQSKRAIESIADQLFAENKELSDEIMYIKEALPLTVKFYELAVAAYVPLADKSHEPAAIQTFFDLYSVIGKNSESGFDDALKAVAKL